MAPEPKIDWEAILARRAERAPEDDHRRRMHMVARAVLAQKREDWAAAKTRVRAAIETNRQPDPEDLKLALAHPERPPVNAQRVIDVRAARRRVKEAAMRGELPATADILIVMEDDEEA
jgi:hypothetical protein